jgi:hypothetical protein
MTQRPNEQPGVRPTDLVALARHAMTLSHEAEQAWSGALDPETHSAAIDDLNARWSALLVGFHEAVSSAEARLAAEGHVMTLEEWPPSPETAASLDLAADDPIVRYRQLQVAQILAIEQLARALGALTSPTNSRITAMSHEHYWSSGGFERVRTLGGFVMRVANELSQCEAAVIPSR